MGSAIVAACSKRRVWLVLNITWLKRRHTLAVKCCLPDAVDVCLNPFPLCLTSPLTKIAFACSNATAAGSPVLRFQQLTQTSCQLPAVATPVACVWLCLGAASPTLDQYACRLTWVPRVNFAPMQWPALSLIVRLTTSVAKLNSHRAQARSLLTGLFSQKQAKPRALTQAAQREAYGCTWSDEYRQAQEKVSART